MDREIRRTRLGVLGSIPKDAVCAEIGVFRGKFSRDILRNKKPAKLYLIDPWINFQDPLYENTWYHEASEHDMEEIHGRILRRFKGRIERGQVEVLRGKSTEVADAIPDGSLDFIYIDGDHSYEGVKADLEIAIKKCKQDAIIALDDYYTGGWWKDGVVRATSEFLGQYADQMTILECVEKQMIIKRHEPVAVAA